MAKKEFLNVQENIRKMKLLRDELPNSKARRNFDKATINIKRNYDKLYYYAFFDYRFETCNYNKLLEDIKFDSIQGKPKFKLLFIRVPGMVRSYYNSPEKKVLIKSLIERLKKYIQEKNDAFKYNFLYSIDNFLVMAIEKDDITEVYNDVKKIKEEYVTLDTGMYFVKYTSTSSKINKNIDACINEAIKITKEKQHENNGWNSFGKR